MSGVGSGYDQSAGSYSQDGRIYQVEYAQKAVDNSNSCVGMVFQDGIVLCLEKIMLSKMLVKDTDRRIYAVSKHAAIAIAGMPADGRVLVDFARREAASYKTNYGDEIPGKFLAERVSLICNAYTTSDYYRPFGVSVLIAVYTPDKGFEMYSVDPSGSCNKYFAHALGKSRVAAKGHLEQIDFSNRTVKQGVDDIVKVIRKIHDETSTAIHHIEMVCLSASTDFKPVHIADEVVNKAVEKANEELENE